MVDPIVAVFIHYYNYAAKYDLRKVEVTFNSENFKDAAITLVN